MTAIVLLAFDNGAAMRATGLPQMRSQVREHLNQRVASASSYAIARLLICALLIVSVMPFSTRAQTSLQYQNRGNRFEGVKPKPVSGYDIELISALADYTENTTTLPDAFRINFFLSQQSHVYVTVRELDYKYYYWMDQIQPTGQWQPGFRNVFEWPTKDVVRALGDLNLYDLGVVARLENPNPSMVEHVAPVILYSSARPRSITGYLFSFKTNGDARLTCSFLREGQTEAISTQVFRRQRGSRPFTVRWDSSHVAEGSYRLVIKGFFLHTNDPLDQTVLFYHRPDVN